MGRVNRFGCLEGKADEPGRTGGADAGVYGENVD
jgi:hypothetical protein